MALYDAFVSYSHVKDKPIAAALQSVIQKLGKPWYRRRALRVFRDDTSLSATPELWPSIERALGDSGFLILLASPEAAASPWVNKEVQYWLDHKSADTLLIALTDGELSWDNANGDFAAHARMPLPAVLAGRFTSEPKWVDLRAYREGANARDARFIDAGADFAAAVHGMPKEDLLSQEVRQQRRALTLAWSAAGSLTILAGLAGWQWKAALEQRNLAERNFGIAKSAADEMVFNLAQGLRDVQGMRLADVRRILDTARATMDRLAVAAPDDLRVQRSRAAMLLEFAETYIRAGDLSRANAIANEGLGITRKLVAADPGNSGWQRDLSVSLVRVGDVRLAEGDRAAALAAYEESLDIMRKLALYEPLNNEWRRALSVNFAKVGDIRLATGDRAGALAAHEASLKLARELAASDPRHTGRQHDVGVSLVKVGDVRLAGKDLAGALSAYEESLAVVRKLTATDPGNASWQRDLAAVLDKVGDMRHDTGDRAGMLSAYEEALALRRKLVATDSTNAGWQTDLVLSLWRLSAAWEPTRAGAALREAIVILDALGRDGRLTAAQKNWPQLLRDLLAKLPPARAGAKPAPSEAR